MTTDRELLEIALEALYMANTREWPENKINAAINAISARLAEPDPLPPPPECKTVAEKNAYAFGWWKALETVRLAQPDLAKVGEVGVWGQREWQSLTDDEIDEIIGYVDPHCQEEQFARAIEAKLKEKNQ